MTRKKIIVSFPLRYPDAMPTGKEEDGRPVYKLEASFLAIIDGRALVVPAGIEWDHASIPRAFWSIFLPNDPDYQAAALVHDLLYMAELVPREYADRVFLAAMEATGVGRFQRWLMYKAVSLFGGMTYKKHTIDSIQKARKLMGISNLNRPLWHDGIYYA